MANPLTSENNKLKVQVEKMAETLAPGQKIIEVQKKMAEIFGRDDGTGRRRRVAEIIAGLSTEPGDAGVICDAVGLKRATYYRLIQPPKEVAEKSLKRGLPVH